MICNCTEISAKWFWLAYGSIVDGKIYYNLSKHNTIFLKITLDSPDNEPIHAQMGFSKEGLETISRKVHDCFHAINPKYKDSEITIEIDKVLHVEIEWEDGKEVLYDKKEVNNV
jgi:hypothetical protein